MIFSKTKINRPSFTKLILIFFALISLSNSAKTQISQVKVGLAGINTVFNAIKFDPIDGGTINVGYYQDQAKNFFTSLIVKLDANHQIVWQKLVVNNNSILKDIIICSNGDYVAIGGFACRINRKNGDLIWTIAFDSAFTKYANSAVETKKGNIAFCGSVIMGQNKIHSFVALVNSSGNLLWSKDSANPESDESFGIDQLSNENLILVTNERTGRFDGFNKAIIIELEELSGNILRENAYALNLRSPTKPVDLTSLRPGNIKIKDGMVYISMYASYDQSQVGSGYYDFNMFIFSYDQVTATLSGNLYYHSTEVSPDGLTTSYHQPTANVFTVLGKNDFLIAQSFFSIKDLKTKVYLSRVNNGAIQFDNVISFPDNIPVFSIDTTKSGIVYYGQGNDKNNFCYLLYYPLNGPSLSSSCMNIQPSGSLLLKNDQLLPQPSTEIGLFKNDPPFPYTFPVLPGDLLVQDFCKCLHNSTLLNLGNDTTICSGNKFLLNAHPGFLSYLWQDGSRDSVFSVSTPGKYFITVKDSCENIYTDTINISFNAKVHLDKDPGICTGESRILDAGSGFASYLWNNNSTTQTISIKDPGTYWVNVKDKNGCTGNDTVNITKQFISPVNFLPADTSICSNVPFIVQSKIIAASYLWNTGETTNKIIVNSSGSYTLLIKDQNNCKGIDTINIIQKQCNEGFFIPTAFTPNGDGKNDLLKPFIFGNVVQYHFTIYNRWGQKIFESNDINKGWDGKIKDTANRSVIYIWTCSYQIQGGTLITQKGTVALIN